MRIITDVFAMEVNFSMVVSISRADFQNGQSRKDVAQDAGAPARAKYRELQSALRVPEFGRRRARALNAQQES